MRKLFISTLSICFIFMLVSCKSNDPEVLQSEILEKIESVEATNQLEIVESVTLEAGRTPFVQTYDLQISPYQLMHKTSNLLYNMLYLNDGTSYYKYTYGISSIWDIANIHEVSEIDAYDLPLYRFEDLSGLLDQSDVKRVDGGYQADLTLEKALEVEERYFFRIMNEMPYKDFGDDVYQVTITFSFDEGYRLEVDVEMPSLDDTKGVLSVELDVTPTTFDAIDLQSDDVNYSSSISGHYPTYVVGEDIVAPNYQLFLDFNMYLEPGHYALVNAVDDSHIIESDVNLLVSFEYNSIDYMINNIYVETAGTYQFKVNLGHTAESMFRIEKMNYVDSPLDEEISLEAGVFDFHLEGIQDAVKYAYSGTEDKEVVIHYAGRDIYFYVPYYHLFERVDLYDSAGSYILTMSPGDCFYIAGMRDEVIDDQFSISINA